MRTKAAFSKWSFVLFHLFWHTWNETSWIELNRQKEKNGSHRNRNKCKLTVNSPVIASNPTCTVCSKFCPLKNETKKRMKNRVNQNVRLRLCEEVNSLCTLFGLVHLFMCVFLSFVTQTKNHWITTLTVGYDIFGFESVPGFGIDPLALLLEVFFFRSASSGSVGGRSAAAQQTRSINS